MIKVCCTCNKKFQTFPSRHVGFCSYQCYWKSKKGKPILSIHGRGLPSGFKNKHHSEISKQKIRQAHIGRKASEETKKKLSIVHTGFKHSEKSKLKMSINQLGDKGHNWKGGKIKNSEGYILRYNPNHLYAVGNYVFEHRLVMEKHLGRNLNPKEIVHHINGKIEDNRIDNLMLFNDVVEHVAFHKRIS